VDFGQGDGGDAVVVHVGPASVAARTAGVDVTVRTDAIQQILHAAIDVLAVFAFVGGIAGGQESNQRVAGHGDRVLACAGVPRAVGGLLGGQVLESGPNDHLGLVIDHDVVLNDSGGLVGNLSGAAANAEFR